MEEGHRRSLNYPGQAMVMEQCIKIRKFGQGGKKVLLFWHGLSLFPLQFLDTVISCSRLRAKPHKYCQDITGPVSAAKLQAENRHS